MRRTGAAVLFAVFAAGACSGGGRSGDARLVVSGSATVTDPAGESTVVRGSHAVDFGDTITLDSGTATLRLDGGDTYELRAGTPGTRLVVDPTPELLAGDLLLSDGFPASLENHGVVLTALGPAQLDAEDRVVSGYVGRTAIAGLAGVDGVPALRQMVLAPGLRPVPLVYDVSDSWDQRYLAEAVAFGAHLEALARGITGDVQPGQRSASFFERVLPALGRQRGFSDDLLDPDRPVGETLVGAAISVEGRNGQFIDRWHDVFAFRDAGALWGLVALEQGVSAAPVLETIELAIGAAPLSATPRPTTTTSTTIDTTTSTTSPGPSTSTTTTTTTTVPPEDDPLAPVTDPIDELIGGLLDLWLDVGSVLAPAGG